MLFNQVDLPQAHQQEPLIAISDFVSGEFLQEETSLNLQSLKAPLVGAGKSINSYNGYDDVQKTIDYYWVIGDNFHNGNITIDNYPVRIRLICYGLSQQTKFGDNNEPSPSMWNLKANWKHDAWMKQKGRDREASRKEFIMLAEAILGV